MGCLHCQAPGSGLEGQWCLLILPGSPCHSWTSAKAQDPLATYLGEPEEILHEQARVGVINLHHRDLVLVGHQDVVILVEDGCQVEAPAWEGGQTSVPPPAASSIPQRVPFLREEEMPCPKSPLLSNSPWQKRLVAGVGAGTQRVPADTMGHRWARLCREHSGSGQGAVQVTLRGGAGM